jgi:hypothetical protein
VSIEPPADNGTQWLIASAIALVLSAFKSLAHQQSWRSPRFAGMIVIAYVTWSVSAHVKTDLSANSFTVSLLSGGAAGVCASLWAIACRTDVFAISVTPVLFLVPVALSEGDAGLQAAAAGTEGPRHPGALLAVRMLQVVWGIAVGLFLGCWLVLTPHRRLRDWVMKRRGKRVPSDLRYRTRL